MGVGEGMGGTSTIDGEEGLEMADLGKGAVAPHKDSSFEEIALEEEEGERVVTVQEDLSVTFVDKGCTPLPTSDSRFWVMCCVLLAGFAFNLSVTILSIALTDIQSDFGEENPALVAWVTIGPIMTSALFSPIGGRLGDEYGQKRLWTIGVVLTIASFVLCIFAPTVYLLILARVITGIGIALSQPNGISISTLIYPAYERSIPLSYWTATLSGSPAVGVIIGGLLLQYMSWRFIFVIQLPVAVVSVILGSVVLLDTTRPVPGRFDFKGAFLLLVFALCALLLINQGPVLGWLSWFSLVCFVMMPVSSALFIWNERTFPNPIIPIPLFADNIFSLTIIIRAALNAVYMGSFIILPFYLRDIQGYDPLHTALILVVRPFFMFITSPIAGRIALRLQPTVLIFTGYASVMTGTCMLAYITANTALWYVMLAICLQGLGLSLNNPVGLTLITLRAEDRMLGVISGLMSMLIAIFNSIGMTVMLSILVVGGGESSITGYNMAFELGVYSLGFSMLFVVILFFVVAATTGIVVYTPPGVSPLAGLKLYGKGNSKLPDPGAGSVDDLDSERDEP